MKKQSLRISLIASLLMIVCGLLSSGPSAKADSQSGPCSNQSLRGDYGFAIEGQILEGPRVGPVRGVAMAHFDGQGNMSQVDHVVLNATPAAMEWRPGSGAYTVNSDCTGTATLNNLHFVVVRNGKEIRAVVSSPGAALTSIGIKIE